MSLIPGNKYSKEKLAKELASSKKTSSKGGISITAGVDAKKKTAKSSQAFFENLQTRVGDDKVARKEKKKKKGGGAGGGEKLVKQLKL